MAQWEQLPFPRGQTFYQNAAAGPNLTDTSGLTLEGTVWVVGDADSLPIGPGTPQPAYNQGQIWLAVVRNTSGIALQAKRLVKFQATFFRRRVDGYAFTTTQPCFPVDDQYGSQTIANNDLFYIVVKGPCLVQTSLNGDATNVLNEGDIVVNTTAASSQATSAGRIALRDFSAATTLQLQGIFDSVGRAMTARTTANTATDTLVRVGNLMW